MIDEPESDAEGGGNLTAVVRPTRPTQAEREKRRKPIPRYHVLLWDDDDHSYEYVMRMLRELFGHSEEKSFELTKRVDASGSAVVITTTKEHAELKRDQIHAYGKDDAIKNCKGSMSASIEPAE